MDRDNLAERIAALATACQRAAHDDDDDELAECAAGACWADHVQSARAIVLDEPLSWEVACDGYWETHHGIRPSEIEEHVEEWCRGGSWDLSEGTTIWVPGRYRAVLPGVIDERLDGQLTVEIEPPEPECADGHAHEWTSPPSLGGCAENPGVWGHGGGVVIHQVCRHCGCRRITDTWAQDPDTGEQGLTSVRYEVQS